MKYQTKLWNRVCRTKKAWFHLFDIIYYFREYPNIRPDGFIVPIHEENVTNANNCRGIIIASFIRKLFLRIVMRHTEEFMKTFNRGCVNSLLITNTMFIQTSYIKIRYYMRRLLVFRKFFVKINRIRLSYKLLKCVVIWRRYDIIKLQSPRKRPLILSFCGQFMCKARLFSKYGTVQYLWKWPPWLIQGLCLWSCEARMQTHQ